MVQKKLINKTKCIKIVKKKGDKMVDPETFSSMVRTQLRINHETVKRRQRIMERIDKSREELGITKQE